MDNILRARLSVSGSRMMHGGFVDPLAFDEEETILVNALIDTLIPPEEGWPSAAVLGISDLLVRYLVPAESPVSLYPHFGRAEFPQVARRLIGSAAFGSLDERVEALTAAEQADGDLFGRVRDFVYYVYYGHPEVVRLIRANTRYGATYRGGPQPEGYLAEIADWGERTFVTRGVFIPTERVLRAPQAKEPV